MRMPTTVRPFQGWGGGVGAGMGTEKYQNFWLKKAPYLELHATFNDKTIPLIRPLLGSTKGGLYSRILLYYNYHKYSDSFTPRHTYPNV